MALFTDLLKGAGKYLTQEGRSQAQNIRNLILASNVKRVRPEDYRSVEDYNKALKASQGAYKGLQSELVSPTANRTLDRILGVTPEEQKRYTGEQLYGITRQKPQGEFFSPELVKTSVGGAEKVLSAMLPGGGTFITQLAKNIPLSMAAGFSSSTPGKELESTLLGIPTGAMGTGVSYGLEKLGSTLGGIVKTKAPQVAGKKATLDWGFKAKDIEKLGGFDEARKFATEATSDASKLGLPITTRYQKESALSAIRDQLNNDISTYVKKFDEAGIPVTSTNDVINAFKTNKSLSLAAKKDPATVEWINETISSFADENGNLSMTSLKELMSTIEDAAGGFSKVVGDQSASTRQLLSGTRSSLRDLISKVDEPLSNAMEKLYKYIQVTPSVTSQVTKTAKLPIPALDRIPLGTAGTEISDVLGSLLSGKGTTGVVDTMPYKGVGDILDILGGEIGRVTPSLTGALSKGTPAEADITTEQPTEIYRPDFVSELEQKYFGQPAQQQTEADALNQMLALSVLSGDISASDATAVLKLLGMETEAPKKMTATEKNRLYELNTAEADLQNIMQVLKDYEGWSGPVAGNIAKVVPGSEARKINSELNRLTQSIATGLEKGKLSDQDREFYKSITPRVDDTESERQYKIDALLSAIRRNKTIFEDVYGGGYSETDALSEMLGL